MLKEDKKGSYSVDISPYTTYKVSKESKSHSLAIARKILPTTSKPGHMAKGHEVFWGKGKKGNLRKEKVDWISLKERYPECYSWQLGRPNRALA